MYSIFDSFDLLRPKVFIVSDSEMKEYRDLQRKKDLVLARHDLKYYQEKVAELEARIAKLENPEP